MPPLRKREMEELKVRGTEGTCQENFDTCHVE